ncbi:MAG: DUF2293 domain-containing protein [Planctomycetaceae bacterium]|nr:DUF2293 domain-containing protein [Planctomycetaceae bacterium]
MASHTTSATTYSPGPTPRSVKDPDGKIHQVPDGWELLLPGDPGLTRRVKAAGPYWQVQETRGRKVFSRGLWADAPTIARLRLELEHERGTPAHAKKQAASTARREAAQVAYVTEFHQAVLEFLAFDPRFAELATAIATLVTQHATPVGSGTVARTQRLTIQQKARSAVVAWMRHQTTAYDQMKIARVKGRRREVRRELAQQSVSLLDSYRQGRAPRPDCPLIAAVESSRLEHYQR